MTRFVGPVCVRGCGRPAREHREHCTPCWMGLSGLQRSVLTWEAAAAARAVEQRRVLKAGPDRADAAVRLTALPAVEPPRGHAARRAARRARRRSCRAPSSRRCRSRRRAAVSGCDCQQVVKLADEPHAEEIRDYHEVGIGHFLELLGEPDLELDELLCDGEDTNRLVRVLAGALAAERCLTLYLLAGWTPPRVRRPVADRGRWPLPEAS